MKKTTFCSYRVFAPMAFLLTISCSFPLKLRAVPEGVPRHFLVQDHGGLRTPRPGEGCRNPLLDPSTGTALTLVRSADGMGDYSVPKGLYGLKSNELLRVECATGVPIGVVTR